MPSRWAGDVDIVSSATASSLTIVWDQSCCRWISTQGEVLPKKAIARPLPPPPARTRVRRYIETEDGHEP